ncbi:hypothetical protein [Pseudoduganella sp. RAF53_2]|uniref:hypothetical protein n=1 Tax=unclassified Pseudoduganella TaxID=2637179 RepID=UPI003F96BEBF
MTTDKQLNVNATIGALLEAAIRDQDAVHKAAEGLASSKRTLDAVASQLPGAVASSVDASLEKVLDKAAKALLKNLNEADANAERASAAYERAAQFAVSRIVIWALGITTIAAMTIIAVAWLFMPDLAELQARRAERDALEKRIAWLKQVEGSDISNCILADRRSNRVCARIDSKFPDAWNGYRILSSK